MAAAGFFLGIAGVAAWQGAWAAAGVWLAADAVIVAIGFWKLKR